MTKRLLTILVLILIVLLPWTARTGTAATTYEITRISQAPDGTGGNYHSSLPDVSADGRYVAFMSGAYNLVEPDISETLELFLYDRRTSEMTRISVSTSGAIGNSTSLWPVLSADGRYVAFTSFASNLIDGVNSGWQWRVFVRDRQAGTTTVVSVATDGTTANLDADRPAMSVDGRYVAFESRANNLIDYDTDTGYYNQDVFVHDRQTGETTMVSVATDGTQGDLDSEAAVLSGDGRYVAFSSMASLVPEDTNGVKDVFIHDRQTGETTRVSVATGGVQGNGDSNALAMSGDARYVVFDSKATNLVDGDTNGAVDIFVHDRQTGTTTRVSVAADGTQGEGPAYGCRSADISADGRWIAFTSQFYNLVPGDDNALEDAFLLDRQTGQVTRLADPSDEGAFVDAISDDGTAVAFTSRSSELVPGGTGNYFDVFLWAPTMSQYQSVFLPLAVKGN